MKRRDVLPTLGREFGKRFVLKPAERGSVCQTRLKQIPEYQLNFEEWRMGQRRFNHQLIVEGNNKGILAIFYMGNSWATGQRANVRSFQTKQKIYNLNDEAHLVVVDMINRFRELCAQTR